MLLAAMFVVTPYYREYKFTNTQVFKASYFSMLVSSSTIAFVVGRCWYMELSIKDVPV